MMNVNPVGGVHPAFEAWLHRRRQRMRAQLSALEDERYHDLIDLLDVDTDDRPPDPGSEWERREYRRMLRDQEELGLKLVEMRARLLSELRDVQRMKVAGASAERTRALGGSLDGYL